MKLGLLLIAMTMTFPVTSMASLKAAFILVERKTDGYNADQVDAFYNKVTDKLDQLGELSNASIEANRSKLQDELSRAGIISNLGIIGERPSLQVTIDYATNTIFFNWKTSVPEKISKDIRSSVPLSLWGAINKYGVAETDFDKLNQTNLVNAINEATRRAVAKIRIYHNDDDSLPPGQVSRVTSTAK